MQGQLDFKDIQAIVLSGYGKLPLARYVFLRIEDPRRARKWLRYLEGEVTTEAALKGRVKKLHALNVAFTADGLRALGFGKEELDSFPPEFVEGMAKEHRARILGDTGWSSPRFWEFGGTNEDAIKQEDIHVVLMFFTEECRSDTTRPGPEGSRSDKLLLDRFHERQRREYEAHGLKELFVQDTHLLRREGEGPEDEGFQDPFGFRDGISQPRIEGFAPPSTQGQSIKPGEIILGYENAHGRKPDSPSVPDDWDVGNHLPDAPDSSRKDLGRNGSYMVIRKLWQNVEAFNAFLEKHGDGNPELLAARLMGRWRSGAPLSLSPERDDPELGADRSRNNCFAYAQDPQGLLCPVGSHIRRSNPRDALIAGDREGSLAVVARHHIIRRGRPYLDEGPDAQGRVRQGIFFVALNANIRSQFEFIQHTWLNNSKFGGHYDSKDPIMGDNPDAVPPPPEKPGERVPEPVPGSVTLPGFPVSQRIEGLTRFVEVRGGVYCFLPGIKALRFLGTMEIPATEVAEPRSASVGLEMPAPV
jgi:Dyp-type peroxidase family